MISFPNAKINLGLHIISKRDDGFHNIESLMYPINLCDILEIRERSKDVEKGKLVNFTSSGIEIPGMVENNLCVKAYHLVREKYILPPVDIHLHKIIPHGAGLGGGSSDAVFVIKMLDELFSLQLSLHEKLSFASKLGSDCAFFVHNIPCLSTGRGDVLEKVDFTLNGFYLVLYKPKFGVSTVEAYSGVIPKSPEKSIRDILNLSKKECFLRFTNDFEESVFLKYPELENIKSQFIEEGASYAAMSGSGSVVFGLFENEKPEIKISGSGNIIYKGII
jgi:4-diphosphocytidyl-2-C-methyl-D-erythritol kinase